MDSGTVDAKEDTVGNTRPKSGLIATIEAGFVGGDSLELGHGGFELIMRNGSHASNGCRLFADIQYEFGRSIDSRGN